MSKLDHLPDEELENPELTEEEKERLKVQAVEDFYENELDETYKIVKEEKARTSPGERVQSIDISDYLLKKEGRTNLANALKGGSTAALSYQHWNQFRKNLIDLFNDSETKAISDFMKDKMTLTSPLWDDLEAAAALYQKMNPELQGKDKADYFISQAKLQRTKNKEAYNKAEDKIIGDFFEERLLDENFWSDREKALAQIIKDNPQYLNKEKADYFLKLFDEKVKAYNEKENKDFETFLKSSMPLTSPLWEDLDKAVAEFQKLDPRYATKKTADWLKDKLSVTKAENEDKYNELETTALNNFIEEAVAKDPTVLDNPNTLIAYFQKDNEAYSSSLKTNYYLGQLKSWQAENEKKFFARENAAVTAFIANASPSDLDNPQGALIRYQNETEFKTQRNGEWFTDKFEAHRVELRSQQNKTFRSIATQVGDPVIANAMIRSFEETPTFVLRDVYLNSPGPEGINNKVAEYAPLVAKIKELEKKVKTIAGASKELGEKLMLAQSRYESGKTHYDTTFYSPKAYSEYLNTLLESSDQMVEKEAVIEISNKSFKDVPDLPKRDLNYEDFRDQLKNKKFYKLHSLAYKNQNVRQALKEKNTALHKQWTLARQDFLRTQESSKEKARFRMIEKARQNISRARLADIKGLPTQELTYEPLKNLVKSQNAYGLTLEQQADPSVRRIMREKNEALMKDHNRLLGTNIRAAVSDIKTKDLEHSLDPSERNLGSYSQFRDYLKSQKVYDSVDPALMKNQEVRKAAQEQNQSLYQKLRARFSTAPAKIESPESQAELDHHSTIDAIDKFGLLSGSKAGLMKNYSQFEKAFLEENPDLKQNFFDRKAYRTLLQTQWKDLQKPAELDNKKPEKEEEKENLAAPERVNSEAKDKLPGHYKIKWDDLDKRLDSNKQSKGIDRFSKLLNRSESGLQTLMQHFHQPLGTFMIEALAVAPQEKFDKIFNAVRDNPVTPGNREQASDWLQTFCETIGVAYLQKETAVGFASLKQNYQTYFGQSLVSTWEIEDQIIDEDLENSEDNSPILDSGNLEDDTDQSTQNAQGQSQNNDELENETLEIDDVLLKEPEVIPSEIGANESDPDDEVFSEIIPQNSEAPILDSVDIELAETEVFLSSEAPENTIDDPLLPEDIDSLIDEDSENEDHNIDDVEATELGSIDEPKILLDEDLDSDSEIPSDISTVGIELEAGVEMVVDDAEMIDEDPDIPTDSILENSAEIVDETLDTEDEEPDDMSEIIDQNLEETETEIIPVEVTVVLPKKEVKTVQKEEALTDWQDFLEAHAAPKSVENQGANIMSGPQELAPEMWQEITTDSEIPIPELSEEALRKIMLTPEGRRRLKVDQQKFYDQKTEQSHFYPTLYAEVHLASYITIEKFLQQIKSYSQLTFDIEADLIFGDNKLQEISAETAQELFKSVADKLHQSNKLKSITISSEGETLKVITNKNVWHFPLKIEELV